MRLGHARLRHCVRIKKDSERTTEPLHQTRAVASTPQDMAETKYFMRLLMSHCESLLMRALVSY